MRLCLKLTFAFCLVLRIASPAQAQSYAIGADVSFLAKCERDGMVFKEDGQPKDVLVMLREHQYNWVRLRLFHDPAAAADKLPNDLDYTLTLAKRAKSLGFHLLLDLHYSDSWADPGKQPTPEAWKKLKHKQLVEQVFTYTRDTISTFAREGVMPDMVQVGNEITNGMLWPDGKLPDNWDNFADLLKAGIRGVDAGRGAQPKPRIMIHIERSGDYDAAVWFFDNLIAHHVPFDVMGLSYYPRWHGGMRSCAAICTISRCAIGIPSSWLRRHTTGPPGTSSAKRQNFRRVRQDRRIFCAPLMLPYARFRMGSAWEFFGGSPLPRLSCADEVSLTMTAMFCR